MSSDPKTLIRYAIGMTVLTVLAVYAAYLARGALLLVYLSALLAIGFSPTVRLIERQKMLSIGQRVPRWLAILTLYVGIIGVIVAVGFVIVPPLVEQAQELRTQLPAMLGSVQGFLQSKGIDVSWSEALSRFESGGMIGTAFGALAGVAGGALGLLTILLLTFYFLLEGDQLRDSIVCLFPPKRRPRLTRMLRDIVVKVSAWVTGQVILGAVIGATTALALWLMGIPFFYVLALISAVGELIPVVGPILSAVPAIAVAGTISLNKAILVLIFFVVQQQLESNVLAPKIMEKQVGISATTVVIALLIGGELYGIVGAILSVPTAAIVMVVFYELTGTKPAETED